MFLTKNYFKNFQYGVVGLCVFMAVFVGSIQTALIIKKMGEIKNGMADAPVSEF